VILRYRKELTIAFLDVILFSQWSYSRWSADGIKAGKTEDLNFNDPDNTDSTLMVVRLHHGEVSVSGKTKLFDIPLHFRFSLFPWLLLIKDISSRVTFNLFYRKPQTATLHSDYSQARIDSRWSIVNCIKLLNCINFPIVSATGKQWHGSWKEKYDKRKNCAKYDFKIAISEFFSRAKNDENLI